MEAKTKTLHLLSHPFSLKCIVELVSQQIMSFLSVSRLLRKGKVNTRITADWSQNQHIHLEKHL